MSRRRKPISRSTSAEFLRLFRRESHCRVLGPSVRAVLWVQGCQLACPGCLVPNSWSRRGGERHTVSDLVDWVLAIEDIEGLTLSGGEPTEQTSALVELITRLREHRDLGVVCYTGHYLEELGADHPLLRHVDLLIDGPYRKELHADLLWRGSSNQRLHWLTPRYRRPESDAGVGLEFCFQSDGRFTFAGVPPWPDFVKAAPFR